MCDYQILETQPIIFGLYIECFSNREFCTNYSIDISPPEFRTRVEEIALRPFNNLRRYTLVYKKKAIFFAHFLLGKDYTKVSGGISPDMFNSGKGLLASAILFDFYFKSEIEKDLLVEINLENNRSLRVVQALGFTEICKAERQTLVLQRKYFPTELASNLLSKIEYESKQGFNNYFCE